MLPGPSQQQLSVAKLVLLCVGRADTVLYSSFRLASEADAPAKTDCKGNGQETISPFKGIGHVSQWGYFNVQIDTNLETLFPGEGFIFQIFSMLCLPTYFWHLFPTRYKTRKIREGGISCQKRINIQCNWLASFGQLFNLRGWSTYMSSHYCCALVPLTLYILLMATCLYEWIKKWNFEQQTSRPPKTQTQKSLKNHL